MASFLSNCRKNQNLQEVTLGNSGILQIFNDFNERVLQKVQPGKLLMLNVNKNEIMGRQNPIEINGITVNFF